MMTRSDINVLLSRLDKVFHAYMKGDTVANGDDEAALQNILSCIEQHFDAGLELQSCTDPDQGLRVCDLIQTAEQLLSRTFSAKEKQDVITFYHSPSDATARGKSSEECLVSNAELEHMWTVSLCMQIAKHCFPKKKLKSCRCLQRSERQDPARTVRMNVVTVIPLWHYNL